MLKNTRMIIISGQTKDDRNGGLQGKNPVRTAINVGTIQQIATERNSEADTNPRISF
jgi:hypothetical protein